MLAERKITIWIIAASVITLSMITTGKSFAFRATDLLLEEQAIQSTSDPQAAGSPQRAKKQFSTLQTVVQRNLKHSITGDPQQAALQLAEEIMNGGSQQVSVSGASSGATTGSKAGKTRARLGKAQNDGLGFQHIRVSQEYKGLPVVGAELIVHVNDQGIAYMINGKQQPETEIDIKPVITLENGLQKGLDEQQGKKNMRVSSEPALVVYDSWLAWRYIIEHDGVLPGQWHYYVDAQDGQILNRYNNIQFAAPIQANGAEAIVSGHRLVGEDGSSVSMQGFWEPSVSGNYFLYNFINLWGIYDEVAADWVQQLTDDWGAANPAAVSCAENFENTQNYVFTVLGRNSFNDDGAFAKATVHGGANLVNAYWTGTAFYFGDGDGVEANALTTQDVVAHEYGHALTQYSSSLIYQNESGALNEAYSDIYGTAVEFAFQDDGTASYPEAEPGKADWLLGEDCWLSATALRDMRDPQRYNQPSYYHGTHWYYGTGDNGGVHYNSGVANFAFYLLAMGGSGTNDGHPYTITGIGIEEAAAVALRANYFYHTSTAQYAEARIAWIQAAYDLDYDFQTVAAVWTACGVDGVMPCNEVYTHDDTALYSFDDISTTGTALNLINDQYSSLSLPFVFSFFCGDFTDLVVHDNGIITFADAAVSPLNSCVPTSQPPIIAPFWDDLTPDAVDAEVFYQLKGTAPARQLIIQWQNLRHKNIGGSNGVTFQAILYEGSNNILFQYQDVSFGNAGYNNGESATVGLQFDSTANALYSCNTAALSDGLAILFRPPAKRKILLAPVYFLLLS